MEITDIVDFPMIDKVNAIGGTLLVILTYIFGEHWVLFTGFLALNAADYITGTMKARITKTVSSSAGLKGVAKKFAYWIMVAVAFGLSPILNEIGETIGADLSPFSPIIGWGILAMLLVNEFISVCENLTELGVPIPDWFNRGLRITATKIDGLGDSIVDHFDGSLDIEPESEEPFHVKIDKPVEELEEKDIVTLKVHTIHGGE